jgi:hypothetical protein
LTRVFQNWSVHYLFAQFWILIMHNYKRKFRIRISQNKSNYVQIWNSIKKSQSWIAYKK